MDRSDVAKWVGQPIDRAPTPCLTIDRALLELNLDRMMEELRPFKKGLRAHAKTHKCSRLAHLQMEKGAVGICAAKLSEAEQLHRGGINDILVTGPLATADAYGRVGRLLGRAADLIITFDSYDMAGLASKILTAEGLTVKCLLDIDIGQGRTGVPLSEAVGLSEALAALPGIDLIGIQAYAGHAQHIVSLRERESEVRRGVGQATEVFHGIRSLGIPLQVFSVGGTGSYLWDREFEDVTDIQAGSYTVMDADYASLEYEGGASPYRYAMTVHSTVVSARSRERVTLDAGLKALYRDTGVPRVVSPDGDLHYDWFGDEYGKISYGPDHSGGELVAGDRVVLAASHCDPTVNLHDFFVVVEDGIVTDIWPIDLRGCSQ
jgi:D-serine deaminase-like pyridoxal phosphate-dependent protein